MIAFNRRYAPVYRKAKEIYGQISPDVLIAQKNRPASEYRATLENAIHMVDILRYFCGECIKVGACSKFTDPLYETLTTAQLPGGWDAADFTVLLFVYLQAPDG